MGKRTNDNSQLSKEDYEAQENSDQEEEVVRIGIPKAEAESLAKRRIVKAKRNFAGITSDAAKTTGANPFGGINLLGNQGSSAPTTSTSNDPKSTPGFSFGNFPSSSSTKPAVFSFSSFPSNASTTASSISSSSKASHPTTTTTNNSSSGTLRKPTKQEITATHSKAILELSSKAMATGKSSEKLVVCREYREQSLDMRTQYLEDLAKCTDDTAMNVATTTITPSLSLENTVATTDGAPDGIEKAKDEGFTEIDSFAPVAVFRYSKSDSEWHKLDTGTLRIRKEDKSGKHSMLMRANLLVLLNMSVEGIDFQKSEVKGKNNKKLVAIDFIGLNDADAGYEMFKLKCSADVGEKLHSLLSSFQSK